MNKKGYVSIKAMGFLRFYYFEISLPVEISFSTRHCQLLPDLMDAVFVNYLF